ncbi:hypothetical protein [Aeromonas caviae]|uniref:Uncharacterized protein n=1 Tax=Aeromonas caviae TaxID=648 RepID=A0AAJ5ZH69_AERCA|nr:hypothetical protein [Aeromonas caviae]WFG00324.1 hypothetical protein P5S46_21415 [Aeromonas caviae]
MVFATKKNAQLWAADYLTPGKVWTFPDVDDWNEEVEALVPVA